MTYYAFRQNNSGGSFCGPVGVIVKADSAYMADCIAEASGHVYFDGVENDQDCECCGDRWYRTYGEGYATVQEAYDDSIFNGEYIVLE